MSRDVRQTRLTGADDARILRAYRQMERFGAIKALAERFGRSSANITQAIKRAIAREQRPVGS